jgi:hypothetical protein
VTPPEVVRPAAAATPTSMPPGARVVTQDSTLAQKAAPFAAFLVVVWLLRRVFGSRR